MKISVAMCTYNGEKFICRQMDSILRQTRLPDEILICDDISSDHTLALLEQYKDRGVDVRICRNPENLGFVQNFRKCLSLCSGDVILLCDQDDVWKPNKVEELARLMEEDPRRLSIVTNFHLIDLDGNRISRGEEGDSPFFDKRAHRFDWKQDRLYKVNVTAIFCQNIGPGCTQAIRKEIIPDFLACPLNDPHDYVLNRTAALLDGLYYYDVPLTEYRIHGNQTIGVPAYAVARFRGDYGAMAEEYINLPRELIYHLFFPKSEKVSPPPYFNDTRLIAYYDTVPMLPHVKEQYEKWKIMTQNRTALYSPGKGKWKYFLKQGRYNKYFVFGYGPVERLRLRFWDVAVWLKR